MAVAASKFVDSLLKGLNNEKSIQCAYVASDACKGVDYFSTPLEFGVSSSCCAILEKNFHFFLGVRCLLISFI